MNPDKLKNLPQDIRRRFNGMTDKEKEAEIKKYESEMTPEKQAEIQKFVNVQLSKGVKPRQIKKMVLKKFKVVLI